MKRLPIGGRRLLVPILFAAALGCENSHSAPGPPPPPEIEVRLPVTKPVTEYEDFPGQTQSLHMIEVRARVSGYLSNMCFKEGAEVKKGALLFEIDPRPYKAALDQAVGNLAQAEARLKRQDADLARAEKLVGTGSISREDYDKAVGDRGETAASIEALRAAVEAAKLNMEFTQVKASISGRISRRLIDPWNMVKADETPLTTIVSLDPIYAYFDMDEANALRLIREGKIKALQEKSALSLEAGAFDVSLGLADEAGFPHRGTIDFVDNQIDANTGTLRMRGRFANPDRLLSPGLFVRVRLPIGSPHSALLVSEQALARDQGQKFVYVVTDVVNDEGKVEYRQVKVGRLYDGLREVTEGLKPGERVVVSGIQRIRPKMTVKIRNQEPGVRGQESAASQ